MCAGGRSRAIVRARARQGDVEICLRLQALVGACEADSATSLHAVARHKAFEPLCKCVTAPRSSAGWAVLTTEVTRGARSTLAGSALTGTHNGKQGVHSALWKLHETYSARGNARARGPRRRTPGSRVGRIGPLQRNGAGQ